MGSKNKRNHNRGRWHVRAARNMPTAEEVEQYYRDNMVIPLGPPIDWPGTIREWQEAYIKRMEKNDD